MIGESILLIVGIAMMVILHGFAIVITPIGIFAMIREGINRDNLFIFGMGFLALLLIIAFWCVMFGI